MSAFAYKDKQTDIGEIGRKLRVNHALSGSVQKSGERVRINIRLDRTRDGTTLWSERYDRVLDDIFELQDDIAKQVETSSLSSAGSSRGGMATARTCKSPCNASDSLAS